MAPEVNMEIDLWVEWFTFFSLHFRIFRVISMEIITSALEKMLQEEAVQGRHQVCSSVRDTYIFTYDEKTKLMKGK